MKLIISFFTLVLLLGCQATMPVSVSPHKLLHDEVFPAYVNISIESEEKVFALDDAAKKFVDETLSFETSPKGRVAALINRIFDHSEMNLLYVGSANTVASETFHNRAANCLSLSVMAYSMAKYAGFGVRFQNIEIPEYWTRREGFSLINGHINLEVTPRKVTDALQIIDESYEVDFDPQTDGHKFPKKYITRQTILAMFYNNKGADALLSGEYTKAYAYFRTAIASDPMFDPSWVNLGFLYRLVNQHQYAEESYLQALELEKANLTAWENLAHLYEVTDRPEKASKLKKKVEVQRKDNPFHHFTLGEEKFERAQWTEARDHYREALKLDKSRHEIYFGLAKTYYQLGEMRRSALYFRKARKLARNSDQKETYQSKLSVVNATIMSDS